MSEIMSKDHTITKIILLFIGVLLLFIIITIYMIWQAFHSLDGKLQLLSYVFTIIIVIVIFIMSKPIKITKVRIIDSNGVVHGTKYN